MYSDTHCHLKHVGERGENLQSLVALLDAEKYRFILDIGTKPGDLASRVGTVLNASAENANLENAARIPPFIHFTAGLWPDAEVIAEREDSLRALESDVKEMLALAARRAELGCDKFAALGECGLDRYWNGDAAAKRASAGETGGEDGPGTTDVAGEEELFGMQLDMAKRYALPVIVHSRDAFDATLGCIKNSGFDSGVIHCFSYGTKEARAFLDRGWLISFPGNITWQKKAEDRDRVSALIKYVPRDRLLLETDAPYLTPAPHRGKTNTPYLVRHVYERVAECLEISNESLAEIVYANARSLFLVR